jgi:phosphatidylglycerol:prolipoprotein diacylglycerol transferase
MHPRIFGLLTFPIFLSLAVAVGTAVHLWLAKRAGLPVGRIVALYTAIGLAMFVGARAFSVLLEADPGAARWIGSRLRYPGALLALAVAIPIFGPSLGRGIPLRLWGDMLVPGAAFSLAILRVDCFLTGCCAGGVCHLPWAMSFPAGSKPWYAQVMDGAIPASAAWSLPIHPLQLYFLLLSLAVGVFALWWLPRRQYEGQLVLLFLALHELGKFALEFLREPPILQVQLASLAIGLSAAVALVAIHLRGRAPARLGAT